MLGSACEPVSMCRLSSLACVEAELEQEMKLERGRSVAALCLLLVRKSP